MAHVGFLWALRSEVSLEQGRVEWGSLSAYLLRSERSWVSAQHLQRQKGPRRLAEKCQSQVFVLLLSQV